MHAFFTLFFPILLPTEPSLRCPFCYGQSVVLAHKNRWRFHSSGTCCSDAIQLKSRNPFQVVFPLTKEQNFPQTLCLEFELGPKIGFQISEFELAFFARIRIIRIQNSLTKRGFWREIRIGSNYPSFRIMRVGIRWVGLYVYLNDLGIMASIPNLQRDL